MNLFPGVSCLASNTESSKYTNSELGYGSDTYKYIT